VNRADAESDGEHKGTGHRVAHNASQQRSSERIFIARRRRCPTPPGTRQDGTDFGRALNFCWVKND
jgi:hypothetical protein